MEQKMQIEPETETVQEYKNKNWVRDVQINKFNKEKGKEDYFYWMRLGLIVVLGENYIYRMKR